MKDVSMGRRTFLRHPWAPMPSPVGGGGPLAASFAAIDLHRCLVPGGVDCRACIDGCPLGAAALRMDAGGPSVLDGCDGCGRCVAACGLATTPGAIRITSSNGPPRGAQGDVTPWT